MRLLLPVLSLYTLAALLAVASAWLDIAWMETAAAWLALPITLLFAVLLLVLVSAYLLTPVAHVAAAVLRRMRG
jgi:hypothetical protein